MELLYILLILLLVSRIFGEFAERVSQPALVGEIMAGVMIGVVINRYGSHLPMLADLTHNEVFIGITELGIFFLMLYAGLELRPAQIVESSGKAIIIALGGMIIPFASGYIIGEIALPENDYKLAQSIFLGTAMAITAVPVAIKVLMDIGQLKSSVGQTIVAGAVVDDILSLILLAVLVALIETGTVPGMGELFLLTGKVIGFFALTIALGLLVFPHVFRLLHKLHVAESGFSVLLIKALAYSVLAEYMGLHFIIGAFVAGLFFMKEDTDEDEFENVINTVGGITEGFLAPIFFASIGLHLTLDAFVNIPGFLFVLIAVAFLGKVVGAGLPAYFVGMSKRDAAAVGIGMSGRGAVELILADVAMKAGLFEVGDDPLIDNMFSAIVIVAIVTTLATPIGLRFFMGKKEDGS